MSDRHRSGDRPHRILYTMIRVGDLERSLGFYRDILGMSEIRRETFTEGRFTLAFMGYGDGESDALIELTHNWDEDHYEHGTGYGHVALEVGDVRAVCERLQIEGVNIVRAPGPMTWPVDETGHRENIAFIEDPDGYKIELVERPTV
ncbi:MAG: lactoylglutathione lyase [Candidatus Thiodiazotropha sp.]